MTEIGNNTRIVIDAAGNGGHERARCWCVDAFVERGDSRRPKTLTFFGVYWGECCAGMCDRDFDD